MDLEKLTEQFEKLGESSEMNSLVDGLMKHLLSKEVLYDPMKEIGDKYPSWLEANQGKVPQSDFDRYTKQFG